MRDGDRREWQRELLALVPVVLQQDPARVMVPQDSRVQGGPAVQQGLGAAWHPPMDAQNAQGAVPWLLLGLSGRMSRVGVPACDVVVLEWLVGHEDLKGLFHLKEFCGSMIP